VATTTSFCCVLVFSSKDGGIIATKHPKKPQKIRQKNKYKHCFNKIKIEVSMHVTKPRVRLKKSAK